MALSLQQTDTNGACAAAAFCSGLSANSVSSVKTASVGGTTGTVEVTVTIDISGADLRAIYFECIIAAGVSWDAGNWTVNLNVTTGHMNIAWDTVHICRVNSSCVSQETLASATGLAISLQTTGTKTHTLAGSAATPGVGDKVMVVLGFDNSDTMVARAVGFIPSLAIESPFAPGAVTIPPNSLAILGAGV